MEKISTRSSAKIGRQRKKQIAREMREEITRRMKQEIESKFKGMKDLIEVKTSGNEVVIRMMGETAFDSGEAQIRKEMLPLLKKIASVLKDTSGEIIVAGHTDNVPVSGVKFRSNLQLSVERASRVTEFILAQGTISPERISAVGFGKYRPIATNSTPEGRKRNRRVEIIIKDAAIPD